MNYINLLDIMYPVGSVYITISTISPSALFGGNWVQIKDTGLRAVNNSNELNMGIKGQDEIQLDLKYLPNELLFTTYNDAILAAQTSDFTTKYDIFAGYGVNSGGNKTLTWYRPKTSDAKKLYWQSKLPLVSKYTPVLAYKRIA